MNDSDIHCLVGIGLHQDVRTDTIVNWLTVCHASAS
jgi:hypothetical protein